MPDPTQQNVSLHIDLLGEFAVLADAIPVGQMWSARVQALLAYLLLHRATSQARTQIAFTFWPETTSDQAHTNLRQLLHHLRHALPDADRFLHVTSKTVQWRADAPFTLDVADFTARLAEARQAAEKGLTAAQATALVAAIQLYRGDLFPTCYDEWLLPLREQLRTTFAQALEQLILLLEAQQDYPAAIRYAQRLLHHDPLHEATYRHLMRLHAANRDRAAALRVYHTCVTILERELGVPPHQATQTLYQQLLQDRTPTSATPAVAVVRPGRAPLVGRQAEWRQLQALWQQVVQGRSQVVLIAGEAGLGKTRLAEELLHWVSQQGIVTAQTRAYAAEGALAYAPVSEWLSSSALAGGVARLADHWLLEIARLLPELLTTRPHLRLPAVEETIKGDSGQRKRLFEALARGILASPQPLLLLLDDLQWCDGETLEWLHYLLRFDPQARFLLLATLRPEEIEPTQPLSDRRYRERARQMQADFACHDAANEAARLLEQLAQTQQPVLRADPVTRQEPGQVGKRTMQFQ